MKLHRRDLLLGLASAGLTTKSRASTAAAESRTIISVVDFGARGNSGQDDTRAIQSAIDAVEKRGGGTVLIPAIYRCGNILVSGRNVKLQGKGLLVNGRLSIAPGAENIEIADLGLIDTTGQGTYLLDVYGRKCSFRNLQLVKNPPARGYQMYVRQQAAQCHFDGLVLRGGNGIFLAGVDHSFENFDLESKGLTGTDGGGDDGFAIKAVEALTQNIVIRNGVVRGFAAIVSFGSEIGSRGGHEHPGIVRNVTVENVVADRCSRIAFFKPGALRADWRNGMVDGIRLRNLSLHDAAGEYFRCGIQILAARGATIRDVQASNIEIVARAKDQGVAPTAAIGIMLLNKGAPAMIEGVQLQVSFNDPYLGALHGDQFPGYPVDYIVQIEKRSGASGSMSGITLNVDGRGAGRGGIFVGSGLDGAVRLARAVIKRVATDPRASRNGAGIWSNSKLNLGDIVVDSANVPKFGGSAFAKPRH